MLKRNGWTRSRIALREWMPVIVLMCCTFVFNTSEFIPIGLLSDIAADFGITEARAGLLITTLAMRCVNCSTKAGVIYCVTNC